MARKPTKAETMDTAPMLALIDADAREGDVLVAADPSLPVEVQAQRAAQIVLLNPERFDAFYERMKAETDAHVPDLTTAAGRDAIRSLSFKVTKTKTTLDKAGLALTAEWRAQVKAVNDARSPIVERLDKLAAEVRKPLTDWEEAEKARTEANDATIAELIAAATVTIEDTAATVEERGRRIHDMVFEAPQWSDEEAEQAVKHKATAVQALVEARNRLRKEEADRAELEELRALKAERDRIEAEREAERLAAEEAAAEAQRRQEAAEREKAEAEEQAERDRIAAEQREAEAAARAEQAARDAAAQAKREAEEAAAAKEREAEQQRAAERAEHERQLAEAQAERDKIARESREAEAARQKAEEQRIAKEKSDAEQASRDAAAAAEVERKRQENVAHRRKIAAEIADDLMAACDIEDREVARKIVLAIGGGHVRHVGIKF